MSYPYIEIGGERLSLIRPFTIDDQLIVDIHVEATTRYLNANIHYTDDDVLLTIRDLNDRTTTILISDVNNYMNRIIENRLKTFLCQHSTLHGCYPNLITSYEFANEESHYMGRECLHMLYNIGSNAVDIFNHLIIDITHQCREIRRNGICNLERELRQQGRRVYLNEITCTVNYFRYGWDALYYTNDESQLIATRSTSIIHSHGYTPQYNKHFITNENESTTILLGAEIEVDCGGKSETHAKEVMKIMNGEKWDSEDIIYCVHDGSLSNGLEFPTQPGSLAWHKTLPYEKMFKYLDDHGYKAHDTQTCGLHVHINRSFFGDKESECIGKLMFIIEKFNDEFSILGRRDCRYSKLLGYNGEKCKELYQKGYQNRDKYHAINLLHADTIEIRAFKGTLKYSTFINTLEFVSDLANFVKNHSEDEVENMQWSELYNTFSDDLKEYYDGRAKIESEKVNNKTDNCQNNEDTRRLYRSRVCGAFRNLNNSFINLDLLRACECTSQAFDNAVNSLNNINDTMQSLSIQLQNLNDTLSQTPKEVELKNLKKQLKTEKNYMAKISLNRKINKLQKEIKKEKKRNNQST